jgi:hypothetical protein
MSTVATLKERIAPTVRRLGLWHVARASARAVEPYTLHHRKTVQFYAQFVRRGDLCFDIGANLVLQRYLSPEAVLTTWKQACNRSV